jgi:hypothetical protein
MGAQQRPARAVMLTCTAAVLLELALAGCTNPRAESRAESSVSGRAILVGRVPGGSRPFTVGAVRGGKIVKTAEVRPGGHSMEVYTDADDPSRREAIGKLSRPLGGDPA